MNEHDYFSSLLEYEPETGLLRWRVTRGSRAPAGSYTGNSRSNGYRSVRIDGRLLYVHRIAWMLVHGGWPAGHIDHINGVKDDNRIENLREVTRSVNQQNRRRANTNSPSGLLGAHRVPDSAINPWKSTIRIDGKYINLGRFQTPELAHSAYLAAKRAHHEGNTL